MIVTDASALLDLLLHRRAADRIEEAIAAELYLHAPHLVETEVTHVLRRWAARGQLSADRARACLDVLPDLPIIHHAHAPLTNRVWSLRHRFSAYDATYVALAEGLGASLLTTDRRLARGAEGLVHVAHVSPGA